MFLYEKTYLKSFIVHVKNGMSEEFEFITISNNTPLYYTFIIKKILSNFHLVIPLSNFRHPFIIHHDVSLLFTVVDNRHD